MKKISLTCLNFIFITLASLAQSGGFSGVSAPQNMHPAPNAYKSKTVKIMSGSHRLGQIYNRSACGLNYAVDSWIVTKRDSVTCTPAGLGLPANFTFSKLPSNACFKVDTAFLWWTISYDSEGNPNYQNFINNCTCYDPLSSVTPLVSITNPDNVTFKDTGRVIGEDVAKAWGEFGTRTFRIGISPSTITGNGSYTLNISGQDAYEIDGFTFMVIYRDPAVTYQGTLIIDDGCFTRGDDGTFGIIHECGLPAYDTLENINACDNSTYADAFLLVSDLQRNLDIVHTSTLNGTKYSKQSDFFNFDRVTTTITKGQTSAVFGIDTVVALLMNCDGSFVLDTLGNPISSADCYTLAMAGLYYQTTSCVTCVPADTSTALSLTKSSSAAKCGKSDGSATVSPVGGARPYKYTWLLPATGNDSVANNLAPGTYTVAVNDNACKSKVDSVTVSSMGQVKLATPSTTSVTCFGGSNGSATASTTIGTSPFQYLWTGGQTSSTAVNLSAATYTVTVTDGDGCRDSATVSINQPGALVLSTQSDSSSCGQANGTATVTITSGGTSPYSYSWNTSPVPQTTAIATGLADGTYTVVVTDAHSCSKTTSVTVAPTVATMILSTTPLGSSCGGTGLGGNLSATITSGTAPFTYWWSTSPPQTTPSISSLPAGTYTVRVTDAKGCTMQKVDSIPVAVQPNALFTVSQNIACDGISTQFTNRSTLATSYVWNFGDNTISTEPSPSHVFPATGIFVITLTAEKPPCNDIADTTIVIGSMGMGTFPIGSTNIFTPNDDKQNDCFTLAPTDTAYTTAYAIAHCLYLEVFDRWGVKVFESDETNKCWDGNNKKDNKPAIEGTYYYIAKLGETTIKGYVTLIR